MPFRNLQHDIQPNIQGFLDTDDKKNPEDCDLLTPSSLIILGLSTPANPVLSDMEAQLRYAQLIDTLSGLRRALSVVAELMRYKYKEARGVGMNTHAQSLIDTAQKKVQECVATYRRSRSAYLALSGPGEWEKILRELCDGDVRFLSSHQDEPTMGKRDGPREGERLVSWIYTTGGMIDSSSLEFDQGMASCTCKLKYLMEFQHCSSLGGVCQVSCTITSMEGGSYYSRGRDGTYNQVLQIQGILVDGPYQLTSSFI